jgi:hypothetical protein
MKKTLKSLKSRHAALARWSGLEGVVSRAILDLKQTEDALVPVKTVRVGEDVVVVRLVNHLHDDLVQVAAKPRAVKKIRAVRMPAAQSSPYVDQSVEDTRRAVQTLTMPPSDEAEEIYRRLLEMRPA